MVSQPGSLRRISQVGPLWVAAALLAFMPCAAAEDAPADAPSKPAKSAGCSELGFVGTAEFEDVESLGQFEFEFDLKVSNATDKPIEIRHANLLLGHEGGWLTPLDPESLDGSYFRDAISVESGKDQEEVGRQQYRTDTPATYAVLIAQAEDGHCAEAVPILRAGFEPPPAYQPSYPVDLGVIEPLHVIPFADGEDSVLFIGQHQVLNGMVPADVETELSVSTDKGGSQPIKWKGFDTEGDVVALWSFARRLPVFKDFKTGMVGLRTTIVLDGEKKTVTKSWPVKRIRPAALHAPVRGTWQLSNGPGSPRFHDHYASPQYRYAYDLVKIDAKGRTHKGNPHENKSYFAWESSVLAAGDGVVVAYCDAQRDNPGYSRGKQCALNYIVVKHAGEVYTAYLHLKHKSRAREIRKGTVVRAGQHLARVGNSGESSEPHLHFMAFTIDQTGRVRSLPVTFGNAFHDSLGKRPVKGVPLGGRLYHFRGR